MSPVAFKSAVDDHVLAELRAIIGDDARVRPDQSSRAFRAREAEAEYAFVRAGLGAGFLTVVLLLVDFLGVVF